MPEIFFQTLHISKRHITKEHIYFSARNFQYTTRDKTNNKTVECSLPMVSGVLFCLTTSLPGASGCYRIMKQQYAVQSLVCQNVRICVSELQQMGHFQLLPEERRSNQSASLFSDCGFQSRSQSFACRVRQPRLWERDCVGSHYMKLIPGPSRSSNMAAQSQAHQRSVNKLKSR